ncbi:MAG: GerMN domain-containing protein [Acidimicrobiales bacterium]
MNRLVPLLLGVTAVLSTACGIPLSGGPHNLPRSALPQALLQRQVPPAAGHNSNVKVETVFVYLIADVSGDLVPAARSVPRPVTVQEVINALEVGPLSQDYRVGDESAINTNSHLVAAGPVENGTATVQLDHYFRQLQGEAPVQELAQIVWSLTESVPGVQRVRFIGTDGPLAVETDTGAFVNRPVSKKDYQNLVVNSATKPRP